MSLCEGVIRVAEAAARREHFSKVLAITVEIGALGDVMPEAMAFCFGAVSRGTIADGAALRIERVAGAGVCQDCGRTVALQERFGACPSCGGHRVHMTEGGELRVRDMEVA